MTLSPSSKKIAHFHSRPLWTIIIEENQNAVGITETLERLQTEDRMAVKSGDIQSQDIHNSTR